MNLVKTFAFTLAFSAATQAAHPACTDATITGWTIASVSATSNGSTLFHKKFNLVDSENRNRGYIVLDGIWKHSVMAPGGISGEGPVTTWVTDTISVADSNADRLLSKAMESGWKLNRISNAGAPFTTRSCGSLQMLADTIGIADPFSIEFKR